ncbi:MBL fold metallo-hydrolase [Pigmentiphaga aceris]|uniref:MBL fold metallo-hydrolase n=1 Tax=Pigmentiphaga aceris TaxID=1940612 RepID=A0A5C0B475_9BURK|nr:MBL fold metallo-hydrolase [Pigmentiphaga aceris]
MPALRVLERGWLSANSIVFLDGNRLADDHLADSQPTLPGAVVVDTGYVSDAAQTVSLLRDTLNGRLLSAILNTHLHSDHCGGNAAVQAAWHCPILIPPGEADAVAAWDAGALSYDATGQECPRFAYDALLTPGDTLRLGGTNWDVHAAPGHDPHSIMLFAPEHRLLISADALWENGLGIIFPELLGRPGFGAAKEALDRIESLAPDCVIPGHGPAFVDVPQAIARARARLAGFEANPDRHAMYALKVLVQFLLLDQRTLSLAQIETLLGSADYLVQLNQRYLRQTVPMLARQACEALAKSGVAVFDGTGLRLP